MLSLSQFVSKNTNKCDKNAAVYAFANEIKDLFHSTAQIQQVHDIGHDCFATSSPRMLQLPRVEREAPLSQWLCHRRDKMKWGTPLGCVPSEPVMKRQRELTVSIGTAE